MPGLGTSVYCGSCAAVQNHTNLFMSAQVWHVSSWTHHTWLAGKTFSSLVL